MSELSVTSIPWQMVRKDYHKQRGKGGRSFSPIDVTVLVKNHVWEIKILSSGAGQIGREHRSTSFLPTMPNIPWNWQVIPMVRWLVGATGVYS